MIATNCDRLENLPWRQAFRNRDPRPGPVRQPRLSARVRRPHRRRLEPPRVAHRRLRRQAAGGVGPHVRRHLRDRLALTADHPAIQADGTDTTRLTFRAVDAYGNQRPHVTGDVTLSLTGPGQLDGDNPFPLGILRRHRRRLPPLDPRPRRHGDRHRQPRQARLQHDQRDDNPACTQPETRPVSDGCAIPRPFPPRLGQVCQESGPPGADRQPGRGPAASGRGAGPVAAPSAGAPKAIRHCWPRAGKRLRGKGLRSAAAAHDGRPWKPPGHTRRLGSTYSISPAGPHARGSTRRHHRSETSLTKTLSAPVSCVGS